MRKSFTLLLFFLFCMLSFSKADSPADVDNSWETFDYKDVYLNSYESNILHTKADSIPPIDMSLFFDGIDHWMMKHQVDYPRYDPTEVIGIAVRLENPDPRIINAIKSAVEWLEGVKIEGIRIKQVKIEKGMFEGLLNKEYDRVVVEDPDAPAIWARFYEIETNRPFMCNRDGIKVYSLAEVSLERRVGYGWYGASPRKIIESDYPDWKKLNSIE